MKETKIDPPPKLSVVVPCYNEAESLPELVRRVTAVCRETELSHELILVDDGSRDATWALIDEHAGANPAIRGIRLARNHGHEIALTAGLAAARGDRVLMLDADLQDPPELLPQMIAKMDEGYDVVYGKRARRRGETWLKRATSHLFYRLIARLSDVEIPQDVGDFRLVSRRILDAFLTMPEQTRFVRGMFAWLGFPQTAIEFERDARHGGTTKYRYGALLRLAEDALTGFSTAPLRLASVLAYLVLGVAALLVIYVGASFLVGTPASGWASLVLIIVFFSGIQLLATGILGAYVGRLYAEVRGRPLYLVAQTTDGQPMAPPERLGAWKR